MPTFKFEAMDATGQELQDEVVAANEQEAMSTVRSMGYYVTKIMMLKPKPTAAPVGNLTQKAAIEFPDLDCWKVTRKDTYAELLRKQKEAREKEEKEGIQEDFAYMSRHITSCIESGMDSCAVSSDYPAAIQGVLAKLQEAGFWCKYYKYRQNRNWSTAHFKWSAKKPCWFATLFGWRRPK